jgi:hypothetical protein
VTWLAWRQLRPQAVTALAATAAYAILLAATGPLLAALFAADGLDGCRRDCSAGMFTVSLNRNGYTMLFLISAGINLLAPLLIGLFWGAPLIARELETGTAALAWNQSVTRTRWLAVKLGFGALAAMAVTEALALMQNWWAAPITQAVADGAQFTVASGRFSELNFVTHGTAPLGYAAFAFALGVASGTLLRRTLPAMAITLALFITLQVAMPLWIRPHLAPADHAVIPITALAPGAAEAAYRHGQATFTAYADSVPGQPDAWLLSSGPVNSAGRAVSAIPANCARKGLAAA